MSDGQHFPIDTESVAAYRVELKAMAQGSPIAEAAIDGFSDWQVVEAMERMWAVATDPAEPDPIAERREAGQLEER